MRVLMLSWEYPPVVVGGLGRHVHAIAVDLARQGHDITVVSRHQPGAAYDETVEGVRVLRAPEDPPAFPMSDLLAWSQALNHALLRAVLRADLPAPDVVHAHDWLVAHAATALKERYRVPLVATVHATEAGRHQGWLPGPTNRAIHTVEWWLTYEARRVVTCSSYMRWEVTRLFDLPPGKVDVIANGTDLSAFRPRPAAVRAARQRFGGAPLLAFSGRLEWEKGVQTLLAAMPSLRRRHPGVRLVVAGSGTLDEDLRGQARRRRLGRSVVFAGRLPTAELAGLLGAADVALVPSLYEPFGLAALEAATAGAPLVVSDTGGLRELVEDGVSGLRAAPEDVRGWVGAVDRQLSDEIAARRMARVARARAAGSTWRAAAAATADVYRRAVTEEERLLRSLAPRTPLRMVVRDGNLLSDG
ncbi:MAG TPA: glycosyltransferase family 4 protein [Mycobacteriales bacterium]